MDEPGQDPAQDNDGTTSGGLTVQRWFGASAYAGFDALVNGRANRMTGPWGPAKYPVAAIAEIASLRSLPFVITTDGLTHRLDAVAVVVANAPTYGGGMKIAPDADPRDGVLDVTMIGDVSRATLVRVLPSVYSGRHVQHPAVTTGRGRTIHLDAPHAVVCADGEPLGQVPVSLDVVPDAVLIAGRAV
jgi:diacylglycerol kinase (ATP)